MGHGRDEDDAVGEIGMVDREIIGNRAAERVTDDDGVPDTERFHRGTKHFRLPGRRF